MMTTALLGLVAQAEDNNQSEWAQKAKELFSKAESVHLGDVQQSVKEEEKGAYKVEFADGSIIISDATPEKADKVRAVYKRAEAGPQVRKVSGNQDFSKGAWNRLTSVEGSWKQLSSTERNKIDDANFSAWMSHVTKSDHGKAHGQAAAARDALAQAKLSGDKATIEKAQDAYASVVAKIKRDLSSKGEELGLGDDLWNAQEAAMRATAVDSRSPQAAARFRMKRRAAMSRCVHKLS